MDLRLVAMIALARLRLRQEMLSRYPHLIDRRIAMARLRLPMPIELAGLTSRMDRADSQEKEIAALGRRYDKVQNDIDEAIDAHKEHVDDLEHYSDAWRMKVDSMVVKTNGGDPLDGAKTGQSGQSSIGGGQGQGGADANPQIIADGNVGKENDAVDQVAAAPSTDPPPASLTVNGVVTG